VVCGVAWCVVWTLPRGRFPERAPLRIADAWAGFIGAKRKTQNAKRVFLKTPVSDRNRSVCQDRFEARICRELQQINKTAVVVADITPDMVPVIDGEAVEGLVVSTGYSGHGLGKNKNNTAALFGPLFAF
jgi:hypothetical protein